MKFPQITGYSCCCCMLLRLETKSPGCVKEASLLYTSYLAVCMIIYEEILSIMKFRHDMVVIHCMSFAK